MAKVYVAEFTPIDLGVVREPPLAEQTVAIGSKEYRTKMTTLTAG